MVVAKFIWYLISPLLAPLLLIPLAIAWIILSSIVGVCECWQRANGKESKVW